jgi:hypothetical protein
LPLDAIETGVGDGEIGGWDVCTTIRGVRLFWWFDRRQNLCLKMKCSLDKIMKKFHK